MFLRKKLASIPSKLARVDGLNRPWVLRDDMVAMSSNRMDSTWTVFHVSVR